MSTEHIIGYLFIISMLVIITTLVWQSVFKSRLNTHIIFFLVSTVVTSVHFLAEPFPHAWHSSLQFPFLPSFALAIGPSLYLHAKAHYGKVKLVDYYHYAPAAAVMIDTIIYIIMNREEYGTNYELMMGGAVASIRRQYLIPGTLIMRHYTLVIFAYSSVAFIEQIRRQHYFSNGLTIMTAYLALVGPFTWLFIQQVLDTGKISNDTPFLMALQIAMGLTNPIILWHSVLFIFKGFMGQPNHAPATDAYDEAETKDINPIRLYLQNEISNPASTLLQLDIKKDEYIKDSPFSAALWQAFFEEYDIKFGDVKRAVRIAHAQDFVANDFLDHQSVDDLSVKVGYRSRTSFYSAFEEVVGIKFSVYRAEYSLRKRKPTALYSLQEPLETIFSKGQ